MTLPLTSLTLVSGLPKQSVLGGVELGMCFLGEGGSLGNPDIYCILYVVLQAGLPGGWGATCGLGQGRPRSEV